MPGLLRGVARTAVVAGTAWLFCDERMQGAVDTLVVDEAGQVSLANVVATASTDSTMTVSDPAKSFARTPIFTTPAVSAEHPRSGSRSPGSSRCTPPRDRASRAGA